MGRRWRYGDEIADPDLLVPLNQAPATAIRIAWVTEGFEISRQVMRIAFPRSRVSTSGQKTRLSS